MDDADLQEVVEVVGDSTCETADSLHLVSVPQLLLESHGALHRSRRSLKGRVRTVISSVPAAEARSDRPRGLGLIQSMSLS